MGEIRVKPYDASVNIKSDDWNNNDIFFVRRNTLTKPTVVGKRRKDVFHYLYMAFLIVGSPIKPIKAPFYRLKVGWCMGLLIFKTFALIFNWRHCGDVEPDYQLMMSLIIFCIISYVMTLIMLHNGKSMYHTSKTLRRMTNRLDPNHVTDTSLAKKQLGGMLCAFVMIVFVSGYFVFYSKFDTYMKYIQAPNTASMTLRVMYVSLFAFTFITSFWFNLAFCLLASYLCYSEYNSASALIQAYAKKLLQMTSDHFNLSNVEGNMVLFREVCTAIKKQNKAFSVTMLLLISIMIITFLFSANMILYADGSNPVFILGVVIVLVLTLGIFCMVSLSAASIITSRKQLRMAALENAAEVALLAGDVQVFRLYIIFTENILKTKLAASGGQMFVIDKSIILAVFGTIFSYVFLLYQISELVKEQQQHPI